MAATSGRKRKAPPLSPSDSSLVVDKSPAKPRKRCDRRGCDKFSEFPFCFVQATDKCAGDGHTSRWYHLSAGQHFCNECFDYFYRSNKPGNAIYNNWSLLWEREAGERVAPGAKMFIVDQYLPVWVQCTVEDCQRWRKLPPAIELHHVKQDIVKCTDCSRPEDEVVAMVKLGDWISSVSYTPMLRYSLLAPLLSEYFPDGVGISPSTVRHSGSSRVRLQRQREASQARERRMKEGERGRMGEGGEQGEKGAVAGGGQGEKGATEGGGQGEKGATEGGGQGEKGAMEGGGQGEKGTMEGGEEEVVGKEGQGEKGGEGPVEKGEVGGMGAGKMEGGSEGAEKKPKGGEDGDKKNQDGMKSDKTGEKGQLPLAVLHPLHPFNHPHEGPRAQAFTPDVMEPVEIRAFPEFYRVYETQGKWHCPRLEIYCLMRNLILGLWFQNCKRYLTERQCMQALSLRGLLRIWCALHLPSVLYFLTLWGFVNHGFLDNIPRPLPFPQSDKKIRVLVIGAGSAGIAAANHLRNYGHSVQILEAGGQLGGRVKDDFSLGPCVGMGAMFITGICNNPFTLLAEQQGIPLRAVNEDHCDLVNELGRKVEGVADLKVEKHFNQTLDLLSEWRAGQKTDISLEAKLEEFHKTVVREEQGCLPYSAEESSLLDFHFSNLEFACGADLTQVSSLHWDHNDAFSQFSGPHAILPTGYHVILSSMARGIDVEYHSVVQTIEVVGEEVRVGDQQGRTWEANKVVVTVPLSVLKRGNITFSPPLGDRKSGAISRLGAGLVEKVAIRFTEPFWRKSLGSCDFFGHVTCNQEQRGMFGMFYDMSSVGSEVDGVTGVKTEGSTSENSGTPESRDNEPPQGAYILLTTVSGNALRQYHSATDGQIVEMCVQTLRLMFGADTVTPVLGYLVSRWGSDSHVGMSYSYVAVGATGGDYDIMAETVNDRIHFAGEATNRQHPQTVTGAYLSGIREACKIMEDL